MTWTEIFKNLTPDQMDEAEKDLDWILTAVEHPTYLLGKEDKSNMFPLNSNSLYYVEYIKMCLEEKGYVVRIVDRRFISIVPEREAKNTPNANSTKIPTTDDAR